MKFIFYTKREFLNIIFIYYTKKVRPNRIIFLGMNLMIEDFKRLKLNKH